MKQQNQTFTFTNNQVQYLIFLLEQEQIKIETYVADTTNYQNYSFLKEILKELKEDHSKKMYEFPQLSTRVINIFEKIGIITVNQFINFMENNKNDLVNLKYVGNKTYKILEDLYNNL